MSSHLAFALCNTLGASTGNAAESSLFVLQLLAWRKIAADPKTQGVPSIKQVQASAEPGNALRKALADLVALKSLGRNSLAFESAMKLLRDLSGSAIDNLLTILRTPDEKLVDYREAVNTCTALRNNPESYGDLPDELAELAIRIAGISDKDSVYCPFEGSYKLAVRANQVTGNVAIEPRIQSPFPLLLNLLLDTNLDVKFSDPIKRPAWVENGQLRQFDVTLAYPPFNVRNTQSDFIDSYGRFPEQALYGDVAQLRHILAQTKRIAVAYVANSILFRSAAGERAFKQDIVSSHLLRAVIALPPRLLGSTVIPVSMVVLEKNRADSEITFIDATSKDFLDGGKGRGSKGSARGALTGIDEIVGMFENPQSVGHCYIASKNECLANEFNLLPSRYVVSGEKLRIDAVLDSHKRVELGEIAEVMRAQGLPSLVESDGPVVDVGEVGAADIADDGSITGSRKIGYVSEATLQKFKKLKLLLRSGDIVVAIKGAVGKVGIVIGEPDHPTVPGQSYALIRPNLDKTHSMVLYHYLASKLGQALIQGRASGATVPMIQARDLRALPVILPTAAEVEEIIKVRSRINELLQNIEQQKREIEVLQNKHWDY